MVLQVITLQICKAEKNETTLVVNTARLHVKSIRWWTAFHQSKRA